MSEWAWQQQQQQWSKERIKNCKNLIKIPESRRADFRLILLFVRNLLFVVVAAVCLKIGLIAKSFWHGTHIHIHVYGGGGNWWQASTRRCPHATVVKSQQKDNNGSSKNNHNGILDRLLNSICVCLCGCVVALLSQ